MNTIKKTISKSIGLFIDISCERGYIGVSKGDFILSQKFLYNIIKQSNFLSNIIDKCLLAADIKYHSLQFICVGNGPGSFIGTRTAISYAKGLCFGLGLSLFSINTLKALATSIDVDENKKCVVITDAKCEEHFILEFIKSNNIIKFIGNIQILSKNSIKNFCETKDIIIGYSFTQKLKYLKKSKIFINGPNGNGMIQVLKNKQKYNANNELYTCKPNYYRYPYI